MIGISKLYCGAVEPGDVLRYNRESGRLPSHLLQFSKDKKPVVVWNMTRRCNLRCIHCYSSSRNIRYRNELTTEEARAMIRDLAAFGSPVLLFSGGEPLMRRDLPELARFATEQGMRAVISTNGTRITRKKAAVFQEIGLSYVGVSLDGMKATHDRFRGVEGAFDASMKGIRLCRDMGIKVGVRFTINRHNVADVPAIFGLLEKEDIPRCCFYHLVYSGRGSKLIEEDLIPEGVMVGVLTPARDPLIRKTFAALAGVRRGVVHLYNPTSAVQRAVVFRQSRDEVKRIAVRGAELIRELAGDRR